MCKDAENFNFCKPIYCMMLGLTALILFGALILNKMGCLKIETQLLPKEGKPSVIMK